MKVFVVTSGTYDDYRIDSVFSTKEKAEEYIGLKQFEGLKAEHPEAKTVSVEGGYWLHDGRIDIGIEEIDLDAGTRPITWEFKTGKEFSPDYQPADDSVFILPVRSESEDD